eukprot:6499525-Alexandrium_andersonii.AAC.1
MRKHIESLGILALAYAWRRSPLNSRAALLKCNISLCCGSEASYQMHFQAFFKVRELVSNGRGPVVSDAENPAHIPKEMADFVYRCALSPAKGKGKGKA